jgi:hypothetical protein
MADENKKTPGPSAGLGALGAAKKKRKKKLLNANEFFELVDSKKEFTGPKSTKGSLGNTVNRFRDLQDKMVVKMKKGGSAKKKKGGAAIRGRSKILR